MKAVTRGRLVLIAVSAATAAWLVLPTLVVIPMSFTPIRAFSVSLDELSTRWYENFFSDPRWLDALTTSLIVAVLTMFVSVTFGSLAAFAFDRGRIPAQDGLLTSLLAPLLVPVVLLGLGLFYLFLRWKISGTVLGLVAAHSVLAIPLVVRSVGAALTRHDRTMERAAAGLGASPMAVFRQVTLPMIAPGILSGAILAFVISFDEVVMSIFLTSPETQTLPVLMFNAVTRELDPTIAAASTLILVFTTTLLVGGLFYLARRRDQLNAQ